VAGIRNPEPIIWAGAIQIFDSCERPGHLINLFDCGTQKAYHIRNLIPNLKIIFWIEERKTFMRLLSPPLPNLFLILILILFSCGQKPELHNSDAFQQAFGGRGDDVAYDIIPARDNDYIITGKTESFGAGRTDIYIAKINDSGNIIWQTTYGGQGYDYGTGISESYGNGYAIVGVTESFGRGFTDIYLIEIDSIGSLIRERVYGGRKFEEARDIVQSPDKGYMIAGSTTSIGSGKKDLYLIKIDSSGNPLWEKTYGGTEDDHARSIIALRDGNLAVIGSTQSFGSGNSDIYILRITPDGDSLWSRTLGGIEFERGCDITATLDNNLIITGETHSYGIPGGEVIVAKYDNFGNALWIKTYSGRNGDCGWSIIPDIEGGFAIVGQYLTQYMPDHPQNLDAIIFKIDSLGNPVCKRNYGGDNDDYGYAIIQAANGDFIAVGGTRSFRDHEEIYWIRTTSGLRN
jgi:hypothetical protein